MISLYKYIFATQFVFTTKIVPQIWRIFTAFLITKPKFAILLDPYFLYQYGSGLERESSRFAQPGDFLVYTMFVGSVIVVSILSFPHASLLHHAHPVDLCHAEHHLGLSAHTVLVNGRSGSWNRGRVPLHIALSVIRKILKGLLRCAGMVG